MQGKSLGGNSVLRSESYTMTELELHISESQESFQSWKKVSMPTLSLAVYVKNCIEGNRKVPKRPWCLFSYTISSEADVVMRYYSDTWKFFVASTDVSLMLTLNSGNITYHIQFRVQFFT